MRSISQVKNYSKPAFWWQSIVCVGLIGLGFSWGSVHTAGFEVSKVTWFEWTSRCLVLVYGWMIVRRPKTKIVFDKTLGYLLLAFGGWAVVVSAIASDWWHSVFGNVFRHDGLVSWVHLTVFAFVIAQVWRQKPKNGIASAVAWLGILTSVAVFGIQLPGLSWGHGNPSLDAGVLVVTLPFLIYITQSKHWRAAILVVVGALLATQAWAALGSVVLTGLLLVPLFFKRRWLRASWWLGIGLLCVTLTMVFFRHEYQPLEGTSSYHSESRVRIMTKLALASWQKPLGWGWANVDQAFRAVDWPYPTKHDIYVDKAHSEWLEVLVTTGWVGLMLYMVFQLRVVYLLWSNWQYVAQTSINKAWSFTLLFTAVVYIIHSQTNIVSISEQAVFWLLVGVAARGTPAR